MTYDFVFTDVTFRRRRARRVRRLVFVAAVSMMMMCTFWLGIAIRQGFVAMAAVDGAGAVLSLGLLILLRRGSVDVARHLCFALVIGVIVSIILLEGNAPGQEPVLHLYFICVAVAVLLVFFDSDWRVRVAYIAGCLLIFAVRELDLIQLTPLVPPDAMVALVARRFTHFAVAGILLALALVFVRDIAEAERQLAAANERLEVLLESMLPESIAHRLRAEGHTFADAFPTCTILFADVVGFTKMAAQQSASSVVDLLDRVFSRFDDLVEKGGLEKIKTIGDAYMVAGGVPRERPDHAAAVALVALRMQETIAEYGMQLRIGMNTGPVVAGVIGKKRFIYDLWGDAVNVASRMESQGTPGTIQVTEATFRELEADFDLTPIGTIDVRGRGPLNVWRLIGRKEDH